MIGRFDRRELLAGAAATVGLAATPAWAADRFPPGFLWGASTAGHQVEGNNVNSDYWVLENTAPRAFADRSGDAVDSLNRWSEDLDLARAIGLNAYRFSLEWSRIEPERGQISTAMLDYYARVIDGCVERGLKPMVTFSHFTCPRWFTAAGGWTNPDAPGLFANFCDRAARRLAAGMSHAVTLNEPNLPAVLYWTHLPATVVAAKRANRDAAAKALGVERFPAGFMLAREEYAPMIPILAAAHTASRAAIKAVRGDLPVGLSLSVVDDQAVGEGSRIATKRAEVYGPWLAVATEDEFIGVQNYTRSRIDASGPMAIPDGAQRTSNNMEIYPDSLAGAVRYIHQASGRPVLVTEHGVATPDDAVRAAFIPAALKGLHSAIADGVPVLGYVHWSLLDNFEWYQGYSQQYGLCAVDRTTFRRTRKPSAVAFGAIARRNGLA